ncbi:hypothetical protein ACEPAG_7059 [Sanghuangporus baumii]
MLNKQFASIVTIALSVLSVTDQAFGRYRWLERDNKPILLHPRRFGQQNPDVLTRLSSACDGSVCGVLAGQGPSTLLGAAGECTQQDLADDIIDAAQQFDGTTKANMISLAVEFRQVEKNTPPDFTTNPPTNRNSVFCQQAPRNAELNGLVQAQDPANDPNIFFDPALGASVTLGSQANTFPFGTSGSTGNGSTDASASVSDSSAASPTAISAVVTDRSEGSDEQCSIVTVTVSADAAATSAADSSATVTVDVTDSANVPTSTASASDIGDFGSCSVPEIEFGTGFDGRKETSFEPVDKASFNHGSAQNINIITQFICDTLTNTCGADQTAKDTCATAQSAASAATKGTGAQADAFNAAFGITTDFTSVAAVDDQGNIVSGTGSNANSSDASASATDGAADSGATATASATDSGSTAASSSTTGSNTSSSDIGNFGSCSVPEIEFGVGFDGRKETSFQPVDKASYNHGSAQAINIIAQFICDTLTNSCGADQTAKDTCASAQTAAQAATAKTGAQADAFNAAFGITTDFASVAEVDDQGNVVAGTGSGTSDSAASDTSSSASDTAVASTAAVATTATAASATATASNDTGSGGNLQTFTGNLGATAPTVTALGDGSFQVTGNSAFNSLQNALVRSCDVQNNQCANAANSSGNQGDLTVANCNQQQQQCTSQAQSAA